MTAQPVTARGPAAQLVEELRARGVGLRVQGESLVIDAAKGALTDADRDRLRASKADIVAYLGTAAHGAPAPRTRPAGPLPLGLVQQRMWLLDHMDPGSVVNNLPGAWRLKGALDLDAFRAAIVEIVRRHESLRTRIDASGPEPVQIIEPRYVPELPLDDLTALPADARERVMMERIRADRDTPFALDRLPLFRGRLFRLADDEHVFFLLPHHVIWDGWSWDVFHDELDALYEAFRNGRPSPLPELPVQFADYVLWHRALMSGAELERQIGYWRERLAAPLPELALPLDKPRPALLSQSGDRRLVDLEPELLARLWQIGRDENATLFMVMLAAYAAWLMRYTGQVDVTIGVPTQDRLEEGSDRLIGVLVNTLVIRVRQEGATTFRDLLRQVRTTAVEAYDHQDVPFDRLVDELDVRRTADRTPLYQTMFTFQDVSERPVSIGNLAMSQVHIDTGVAPAEMMFACMLGRNGAVGLLDFSTDLFEPATMTRMAESVGTLLRDVAADPDRALALLRITAGDDVARPGAAPELFAARPQARSATGASSMKSARPSHAQQGMWFVERATPGTAVHHLVDAARFERPISADALRVALEAVARAHESLRYHFPEEHGEPLLAVMDELPDVVRHEDAASEQAGEALLAAHARAPFDLARGPLVRALVVRLPDDAHVVQLVIHHMIADEESLRPLYRDLALAYEAARDGVEWQGPADAVFREFIAEEARTLQSDAARRELDYWSGQLAEPAPAVDFGDRTRPPLLSLAGDSFPVELDAAGSAAIDRTAAALDVEPLALVLTALNTILARYTGEQRLAVGVPVSRRPHPASDAVGLFLNTVVAQVAIEDGDTFADHVARAAQSLARARAHASVPFSKVVEQVSPSRSLNRAPLFQVLVSAENHSPATIALGDATARPLFTGRSGIQTDLAFYLARGANGWTARIDYSTDLFDRSTIERLGRHLTVVLAAMSADPHARVAAAALVGEVERAAQLAQGRGPVLELEDASVLTRIERNARAHPDRRAAFQADVELSYGEIWERSGRAAAALRARGVETGDIVGVCVERTPDLPVALLAVWRAGAAYLPLDPEFPEQRLAFMLEDAGARLVVTDPRARRALPPEVGAATLLELERADSSVMQLPEPDARRIAYVIYTSGSTGQPKGVEIEHDALLNFTASMAHEPGFSPDDVLLAVTTLSFDIAGLELFVPLWVGASIAIADEDEVRDGDLLAQRLRDSAATIMQATPATWRMLLDAGWEGRLSKILCGGEAFPPSLVEPLRARADEVWNMFGPTETTIWSTVAHLDDDVVGVPIGRPIANTVAYVIDDVGRLVPHGIAGELWLGGRGVARGYHERPELTAERFQVDPFASDARVYRTGDRARWRADGMLEHLGRRDDQVKVNGYRIELGEIETALAAHPDVRRAVAAVQRGAADDEARLVAYVVWQGGDSMLASEVRRFMAARLPDYMVPGLIVEIPSVPLTPNGKVDRRALPNPLTSRAGREFVEPHTETQRIVAGVWSEFLERERIGLQDNFFELGGHSLLSIRTVAAVQERTGLRIDPRSMFFQTLEQVVAEAEKNAATPVSATPMAVA